MAYFSRCTLLGWQDCQDAITPTVTFRCLMILQSSILITVFALIGGAFQLVFIWNFFHSIFFGKKAEQNPWRSNTLEWTTPVEHMHGNWPGEIPHVHRWSYDYSKPGHDDDFVPQNVPLKEGEEELQH